MVVVLVYAFDTCLDRVQLLKNYYTSRGYEVKGMTKMLKKKLPKHRRRKSVPKASAAIKNIP